jgi:hypothetical protein
MRRPLCRTCGRDNLGGAASTVPDSATHDDLVRDLTEPGVKVNVRPITPSLEDVFVRLTGLQAEAENGAAKAGHAA